MTTRILTGYIARETENAIAYVSLPLSVDMSPLWIPRKKITSNVERDDYSPSAQLKGEGVRRLLAPVVLEVDEAFLQRIGV